MPISSRFIQGAVPSCNAGTKYRLEIRRGVPRPSLQKSQRHSSVSEKQNGSGIVIQVMFLYYPCFFYLFSLYTLESCFKECGKLWSGNKNEQNMPGKLSS